MAIAPVAPERASSPNPQAAKQMEQQLKASKTENGIPVSDLEGVTGLLPTISAEAKGQAPGSTSEKTQVNGDAKVDGAEGVEGLQNGVQEMSMSGSVHGHTPSPLPEMELHRACAEGKLDAVRGVLSRSLDGLETLDMVTGCTPIVLAIRANHHEVVRELLSAGAIIPPPGLTSDPMMNSLLYSGGMYGMPYPQPGQMGNHGQNNYYGFYPSQNQQGPPSSRSPVNGEFVPQNGGGPSGKGPNGVSSPGNGEGNLPPAEVAKTIPCRNFPNCKYGSSCVFFHPPSRPNHANFYPGPGMSNGFDGMQYGHNPYGFNGYPQHGYQPHSFNPHQQNFQPHQGQQQPLSPQPNGNQQPVDVLDNVNVVDQSQSDSPVANNTQHTDTQNKEIQNDSNDNNTSDQQQHAASSSINVPEPNTNGNANPPIPGIFIPNQMTSPPTQPQPFGMSMSPISPSMLSGSLPSIPPADQFFAGSPQNSFASMTNGFNQPQPFHIPQMAGPNGMQGMNGPGPSPSGHNRRQSFGQPFAGGPGPRQFGHNKKLSFSGGPRPFRGNPMNGGPNGSVAGSTGPANGTNLGSWKDGNPPPCAFFAQGKCRNGDLCKFPHLDAQGNDCRHPDVVRGIIPPLPPLGRQPRSMRQSMPGYNPSFDPNNPYRQQPYNPQSQQFGHMGNNFQNRSMYPPQQFQPNGQTPQSVAEAPEHSGTTSAAETTVPESATNTTNPTTPDPSSAEDGDKSTLPSKPTLSSPMPPITRSASQPGIQRVHASGFVSRSHSPAPSNVSFHGNGHPRRGGGRAPFHGNGMRSTSGGNDKRYHSQAPTQRVPRADEFPALGGDSPSLSGNTTSNSSPTHLGGSGTGGWSKTAAQILSMPAPPKPEPQQQFRPETSEEGKEGEMGISMEDEPDSDAVIVSHQPSTTAKTDSTPNGESGRDKAAEEPKEVPAPSEKPSAPSHEAKRGSVSFASVISAPVESSPVVVKA